VALIQTNDNLRGIDVSLVESPPSEAGRDVSVVLRVCNLSQVDRVGFLVRTAKRKQSAPAWIPFLPAGSETTVELRLPPQKRGCFQLPPIRISSVLPMGICFAWKTFADCGTYSVYPLRRGLPLNRRGSGDTGDDLTAPRDDEDVTGHRPHAPGEMASRIDWRIYARTGKLLVRSREGEQGCRLATLRWEDTAFLSGVEPRLEQLSYWIDECVVAGRAFELVLGSDVIAGSRRDACLRALAAFENAP